MKKIFYTLVAMISAINSIAQTSGDWTPHGPMDFPYMINWQISGVARISQMKFHPTDPNIMYAVNAMGGLFITKDKGAHWLPCGTDNLPQTRCASVCIDHNNDQIIYFGTGDLSYYSNGLGIWKSTDGGNTWIQKNAGIGNRLVVEMLMPAGSSSVIAATNDGIWKSTDGGNTWVVKKSGGAFSDMVFQAGSADVIYATTMNEFWRSSDKGETWTKITMPGTGIEGGGRIGVTKKDPNVVYVSFVGNFGGGTSTPILKSTNGGLSFSVVKAGGLPNLNGYEQNSGGQGNYNYALSVDPNDANHLMAAAHVVWNSTNGGVTWTQVTLDWAHEIHPDMRQIPFSPHTKNEVYNINDGGIWRSWDNGESWQPLCNGLMGTESYIGSQSPVNKGAISIGAQDNGEFVFYNGQWYNNGGGDYHSNIIHDNISANYYYDLSGTGRRRGLPYGPDNGLNLPFDAGNGQNVFTDFPLSNTQVAFLGYTDVYRSTNISSNPPTWTKISNFNRQIKAVATSPTDANILYVVTNDGLIRRSDNALATTPTFTTYNTPSATNVTASVVVLKSNTNIVYLLCNNKVYRSTNKGANWTDYTGNLPSVNYHKLLQDVYSTKEAIYLAGYNAVLYRDNTLTNWANFSKGLPTVSGFYRAYIYNDGTDNSELTMISGGRGVWHTGLYGRKPVLREPENPSNAISAIVYQYYEGTWDHLPNFNSLTPVKTGATDVPNLNPKNRNDNFALKFDGYIDVPADGKYTFYTLSDDGSAFYIGEDLIISNDGVHGDVEKSGYSWLKKGKHKFTLTHFQGIGGLSLSFSWEGPGITKQIVPANVLYRLSPPSSCPENGSITVERWNNVNGTAVSTIPVGSTPSKTFSNPSFESKTDEGDNYGVRYRGYLCPPYTGNYVFYVSSDDDSELWLSTTGNPTNKVRIAYLNYAVNQRNWFDNPSQKSAPIALKAGQKYYIEALHKEGGGGDNFAVAMQLPTGEFQVPLQGAHLSPYKNNAFPSVVLTTPANNTTAISGSNINVTATASDTDGSISKVEFYIDDIKVGEDNTSPYNFAWNTIQAGTYAVTARAYDNSGAVSVSSVNKVTVVDLRNPENPALTKSSLDYKYYEYTGEWTVLPNYSSLTPTKTGTVPTFNISVRNRDDRYGIAYKGFINIPTDGVYTFYLASDDGARLYFGADELINNDGQHGMAPELNGVIGLKAGKHAISLNLFQNAGGQGLTLSYSGPSISKTEIPANVLFREVSSNNAPSVTLSSNTLTGTAPANFVLTSNASDNDGTINKIELYINNVLTTQSTSSPLVYNWNNVAVGTYNVFTKAYDDNNATSSSTPLTIKVAVNQNPTITITSPTNNSKFEEPASIAIAANANDIDGSISKVEFYNGSVLLGSDLSAPYNFNWSGVGAGNYIITAKVYDNLNAVQTSAPINITIDKITGITVDTMSSNSNPIKVFPNPLYSQGNISFNVSRSSHVAIVVLDLNGNTVTNIIDKHLAMGNHTIEHDFSSLADGYYFIKATINNEISVTKIMKGSKPKNGMNKK